MDVLTSVCLPYFLMQFPFLTVPSYPKSSLKREYSRHDELPPPRSRAAVDYGSRVVPDRRSSYRDEYSSRGSSYPDLPRVSSRSAGRRPYIDDGYGQRFERPLSYREGRGRDYDSISGSKRPYPAMVGFLCTIKYFISYYVHVSYLTYPLLIYDMLVIC